MNNTSQENSVATVAKSLFDAVERADLDAVAALYHDDIEIWHAAENAVSTKAENLDRLRRSTSQTPGRRYEQRDLRIFPGGFVQRHAMTRTRGGVDVTAFACVVALVRDGRVTHIYEYWDNPQMEAWRQT